jgi:lipopolysaccharide/colanic/teichoic acid biosynthesis glycosyltransferase
MYARYFKRILDFILSLTALIVFSPLFVVLLIVGAIVMKGNPVFVQPRPGKKDSSGKEKIFCLYKLRTMSNAKDKDGKLLPDSERLNAYGKFLRSTSADELPSLINILKGELSIVGPRPQLVRDMVFMTDDQRRRHDVRPGLTGLAQVNGRNNITWERKFQYDLEYIDAGISFKKDIIIIIKTAKNVIKRSDVVRDGTSSDMDFGDWLMQNGDVNEIEYEKKQQEAKELLYTGR